jgi:DNA-binding MarR family transcriptional regulator
MKNHPADQIQQLVQKVFRLDDLLKLAANQITEPAGQTGARWQVLNALDDEAHTVAEIARSKNATRQGVQRIVDELVSEKIVRLKPNPKHQRFPLVELTASGRKSLKDIRKRRDQWSRKVLGHLETPPDSRVLKFLDHFEQAIERTIQKGSK